MSNYNTHCIRNFPAKDRSELIRLSDGMVIACRQNTTVIFGEDPNIQQRTRVFMDSTYAKAFMRKLADIDLNTDAKDGRTDHTARIEEMDGDRGMRIVQ